MNLHEIGLEIKIERMRLGLSQNELAVRSGLSRPRIIEIERGDFAGTRFASIIAVLNALGITLRMEKNVMQKRLTTVHSAFLRVDERRVD